MTILTAAACWIAAAAEARAAAMFVEDFSRLLREKKTAVGVTYRVEGRLSSISERLLRLHHCPVSFRAAEGDRFTLPENTRVVDLKGQFEQRGDERVFVVRKLQPLLDDEVRYESLKREIAAGDDRTPKPWYALARWVGRRAAFYQDDKLHELAAQANRKAIGLEKRQLPPDKPEKLIELAEKALSLGLPDSLRMEYLHEAYRLRWERLREQKQPRLAKFLAQLEEDLPGCKERLPSPQPELEKQYRKNPLATYRDADQPRRRKLHRILYGDVVLADILQSAEDDGSNGYEIAEAIEQRLPERYQVAERHRRRERAYRFENVASLTRREMLQLADRFRRRDQAEQARETIQKWLEASEKRLRREGPAGLMRAADEYVDLTEDRQKAVELLREAYELSPGAERISQKLRRLGLRLKDGKWIPVNELQAPPSDPIRRAAREGRAVPGMTGRQVRGILGTPTDIIRVATAGEISELWIYGEPDRSRLTVHLRRRTGSPNAEVTRVSQVKAD